MSEDWIKSIALFAASLLFWFLLALTPWGQAILSVLISVNSTGY